MARGKSKQELTFGLQKNLPSSKAGGGLFSPSNRVGTAATTEKPHKMIVPKSRSKSPEGSPEDLFEMGS